MTWYRTGTVTVTNGSTNVAGTGTAFVANGQIGEAFLGPDGRTYEITNIPSDTALTITPAYLGSTASGQAYAIAPLRGRIAQLLAETSSLLNSFAAVRDGIGAGLMGDGTVSLPGLRFAADQDTGIARIGGNTLSLVAGGAETLRAGQTSVWIGGAALGSSTGAIECGSLRNADGAFLIDLTTVAGADFNARLLRNGGANGAFEIINSGIGDLRFTQNSTGNFVWNQNGIFRMALTSGGLFSGTDNSMSCGIAANRWSSVFAATGTINTSDAREKHWLGGASDAALRAADRIIGELGFFQWNDAVAEKGEEGARIHFGVRAQEVMRIMAEEGLEDEQMLEFEPDVFIPADRQPSFRHAFLCFDTWEDAFEPEMADIEVPVEEPSGLIGETGAPLMRVRMRKEPRPTGKLKQTRRAGNRFGLRVDQLTMFLLAALAQRVAALQNKETF